MKDATTLILSFNKQFSQAAQQTKYKAIQESTFRFYRGTCHLFYDRLDSIGIPRDKTRSWICGDLHLENFGSFKGDNRLVYFDLNDFDEALLAPLSLEILRFATAILIASDLFKYTNKQAKALVTSALTEYHDTIIRAKALMIERDVSTGMMKDFFDQLAQDKRQEFISRITETRGKKIRLRIDDIHSHAMDGKARESLLSWYRHQSADSDTLRDMQIQDCAHRLAGTGSIGCERYILLVQNKKIDKCYLLDMKEARTSSLLPHVDVKQPKWKNEAERIISIQTRMQFCQPALLRPVFYNGKWFVLKELQPVQNKVNLALANGNQNKLEDIIHPMAQLAAYAHLRSSGRQGSSTADELAEAVSRPKWLSQRFELAQDLAQQSKKDYKDFKAYKTS